jgi:hypothetical protein
MNQTPRALSTLLLGLTLLGGCVDDGGSASSENETEADAAAPVGGSNGDATASTDDAGPGPEADTGTPTELDAGSPNPADVDVPPPPPPEACDGEDDLAPNDLAERAAPVEAGFNRDDLYLCPGATDWYSVTLSAGERVVVAILADPVERDLDLVLSNEVGEVVGTSANDTGEEDLAFTAEAAGTYFVQVVGGFRDVETAYALSINSVCRLDSQCGAGQACSPFTGECVALPEPERACGADAFEPNDTDVTAAEINADGPPLDAVVCALSPDWYALPAEAGDSWEILLTFPRGEDLDLVVRDLETGAIVGSATGDAESNPERALLAHLEAGRYALGVLLPDGGRDGRREVEYRLDVARTAGRCADDADCRGIGRPLCDAASGTCTPVPDAGNVDLGDTCGTPEDCADPEAVCYQGRAGGQDNMCTLGCTDDSECLGLARNAYCQRTGRRGGVCLFPCQEDLDCNSDFRACIAGRCEIRQPCASARDCAEGEVCTPTPFGGALCTPPAPPAECGDEGLPNDTPETAVPLDAGAMSVAGLACQGDRDLYSVTVPAENAGDTVRVEVSFRAGVDIDVYAALIVDGAGVLIGQATSPDQTTEVIELFFAPSSTIYFRVEQFSSDALDDTPYTISAEILPTDAGCTVEGNECLGLEFPRIECAPDTGACSPLSGNGEVSLGGLCDSDDDCAPGTEFCWIFEGAPGVQAGANICTHQCRGNGDCADVPGSECVEFPEAQFAACLPPR